MIETETETGIENDTKAAEEEPEGTAMKRSAQVAHAVPAGVIGIETIGEVRSAFDLFMLISDFPRPPRQGS